MTCSVAQATNHPLCKQQILYAFATKERKKDLDAASFQDREKQGPGSMKWKETKYRKKYVMELKTDMSNGHIFSTSNRKATPLLKIDI